MHAARTAGNSRSLFAKAVAGTASASLAGVLLIGSLGTAGAASFLEKNFWLSGPNYDGNVPACDTPGALSRIQDHFATTESRFWNSSLTIDSFDHIREVAFRPWGEEYIPRRYCSADVVITGTAGPAPQAPAPSFSAPTFSSPYAKPQYSGGKVPVLKAVGVRTHRVYYSIVEDGGFIGASWGVEWCVDGLDRSWTYAPNCRMAKP